MLPQEIDNTLYFIKTKSAQINDLTEKNQMGEDNYNSIIEASRQIHDATNNLQKLLKAWDDEGKN